MANETKFRICVPASMPNKVSAIKTIRMLTGLGLKEAKDVTDQAGEHVLDFSWDLTSPTGDAVQQRNEMEAHFTILRQLGFEVGHPVHLILQDLRNLAAEALKMGEDELANEIFQLVVAEKLRRGV